jgi:hypothetical protein
LSSVADLVAKSKTAGGIQGPNNQAKAAYSPGPMQCHARCVRKAPDETGWSRNSSPAFLRQSVQLEVRCRSGCVYIPAGKHLASSKPSIATSNVQADFLGVEGCYTPAVCASAGQDSCVQLDIQNNARIKADCNIVSIDSSGIWQRNICPGSGQAIVAMQAIFPLR